MGDDNEIRQLIRRESESFLERALKETKDLGQTYDFHHEFGRTKKNRSPLVAIATGITIVVLVGASIFVTTMIQDRTKSMPVDVRAFEDVNLKELLDTTKRNEADKERASIELKTLEDDLRSGLESSDRDLKNELESIAALGLGQEEAAAREKSARTAAETKKRELRGRLEPQIRSTRNKIADIQDKIDKYDQKLTQQAKRQQELLQNERKLFDEEKRRLAASYESRLADMADARRRDAEEAKRQRDILAASLTARYNPVFDKKRDLELLSLPYPSPGEPGAYPDYLRRNALIPADLEARLKRSYENYQYLSGRLRSVPYLNSIPPTLLRMEAEVRESLDGYRGLLMSSVRGLEDRDRRIDDRDKTIVEREKTIAERERTIAERERRIAELIARAESAERSLERFNWALSEFVRRNTEGGYILDPRDPENVTVALNPALPVPSGAQGYVFRSSDRYVGTLLFTYSEGRLKARIQELAPGESLFPLDPILIKLETPSLPMKAGSSQAPLIESPTATSSLSLSQGGNP